jgi:phage terminase large subunit-like protein
MLLKTPHRKQVEILKSKSRFIVLACGRRFGKTHVGKCAIMRAARSHHQACWWIAPTYGMASQVWRELKTAANNVHGIHITESERRIDFPGGGWLAIRSAHNPDRLRGAGLDFVVLDEAAFMHPSVWPEIVRPMLLERKGRALFLSSPNGLNWFWEIYQQGMSRKRFWRAYHYTSADNPIIAPDELESIRAQTPERVFREEYLAEFLADVGQVFRGITEAATAPLDAQPDPNSRYVVGIDWGRENDSTAIVVIDATTRHMVALDRFNQVSWSLQRARLVAIYEHWQPTVIWAEANSIGSPNIEALQAEGLPVRPFVTTAKSKPPLIEDLSLAIERCDLALLPDETLLGELASYRMERLPAGGYRYSAPPGLHDDLVIATALAWYAVRQSGPSIDFA